MAAVGRHEDHVAGVRGVVVDAAGCDQETGVRSDCATDAEVARGAAVEPLCLHRARAVEQRAAQFSGGAHAASLPQAAGGIRSTWPG